MGTSGPHPVHEFDHDTVAAIFALGRPVGPPRQVARGQQGVVWRLDTDAGPFAVKILLLPLPTEAPLLQEKLYGGTSPLITSSFSFPEASPEQSVPKGKAPKSSATGAVTVVDVVAVHPSGSVTVTV